LREIRKVEIQRLKNEKILSSKNSLNKMRFSDDEDENLNSHDNLTDSENTVKRIYSGGMLSLETSF
jgi:hypothetical protein